MANRPRCVMNGMFPQGHLSGLFARAPVVKVKECLVRWGNEDKVNRGTAAVRREMTLERAWDWVAERKFNPDRAFVIDAGNGWTAFFDNHSREFLAQAELYVPSLKLHCDTCFFSHDPGQNTHGFSHFCFNRYTGAEPPVAERQVMVYHEGGWVFSQNGEPLPFERQDVYARPKKRDRLPPEVLREYAEALGVRFWDPASYGTEVFQLRWK